MIEDKAEEILPKRRKYSLEELLENYVPEEMTEEDLAWLNMEDVGKERWWEN